MKRVILKHFYTVSYKRYGHDMEQAIFENVLAARLFQRQELQKLCNEYVSLVKAHSCQKESTIQLFESAMANQEVQ